MHLLHETESLFPNSFLCPLFLQHAHKPDHVEDLLGNVPYFLFLSLHGFSIWVSVCDWVWLCVCVSVCANVWSEGGFICVGVLTMSGWFLTHPRLDYCSGPAVKHSQPQRRARPAHLRRQPSPPGTCRAEQGRARPDCDFEASARVHFRRSSIHRSPLSRPLSIWNYRVVTHRETTLWLDFYRLLWSEIRSTVFNLWTCTGVILLSILS